MTAAVYRTATPSLSIPQTQNTAPVLEFNCLYTHDLRRKAKRWQDGFLRYHTFNRRIMVYDVPRNLIGDAHWAGGEALQDGDEVTLDKGGALVQVAEAVGRTETDLTELRMSRRKAPSERGSSPPARAPQTPGARTVNAASRPITQLKHRSLNALLGTPKGPIGKAALPAKSPFELGHDDAENENWEDGQPPKRQRVEKQITRPTVQPLWARTTDAARQKVLPQIRHAQRAPLPQELVEVQEDEPDFERFLPGFSSDALVPPSSPPREVPVAKLAALPARSSSPGFQTQRVPDYEKAPRKRHEAAELMARAEVAKKTSKAAENRDTESARPTANTRPPTKKAQPAVSERQADTKHHLTKQTSAAAQERSALVRSSESERAHGSKTGATLRMAYGAPKKSMLLCQEQLASKPKRVTSTNTNDAAGALFSATAERATGMATEDEPTKTKTKTQRQLLDERLAKINAKQRKANLPNNNNDAVSRRSAAERDAEVDTATSAVVSKANRRSESAVPETALELAKLDEMISARAAMPIESVPDPTPEVEQEVATSDTVGADSMDLDLQAETVVPAPTQTTSPKKKKGVGKREIRASAQSCFPEPAQATDQQTTSATAAVDAEAEKQHRVELEKQPVAADHASVAAPPKNFEPARAVSTVANAITSKAKRTPGAPMRFTASPRKPAVTNATTNPTNPTAMAPPKGRLKKPQRQAVNLNTTASGTATVLLARQFKSPKPASEVKQAGAAEIVEAKADPWSREAFDLFDYRPPGWDEESWCFRDVAQAVEEVANGTG